MIGTKYLAVALVRCQQHQISCRTLRTTVPLSYRSWKGNKKLEDTMRQSGLSNNLSFLPQCNQISSQTRSLFTSPTLCFKTKKRRKRYPFFWLQDQYRAYFDENMTPQNEEFFQKFLKDRYALDSGGTPLKAEPWNVNESFQNGLQRTGLLGVKLGAVPMWGVKGKRILTTCIAISDNHVIKYHSPEEYSKIARPVNRKRYEGLGCLVVGADSRDPRVFTAEYNGLFTESGVMPKRKLTRFFISHEAKLEPGTPLLASHFRPGMFVDIYGKTKDYGRQGVKFRFKVKGGRNTHGNTKSHNRIGSIGRGRKWCGPLKGAKMPGHHGGERRILVGLKIWRVDTKYNLLYVNGISVPGPVGSYVNVMDSRMPRKTLSEERPPPFPTTSVEENNKLESDMFDPEIHKPTEPSIILEISEEERRAASLAARKGKAKTAQKVR